MQLLDFRPGEIRVVREISEAEYKSYRQAAQQLRDFARWRAIIKMVSANRDEFNESLAEAARVAQSEATLDAAREAIDFDVNRRLLNFLSAMRFFLDHTETRITRVYGAQSPVFSAFKTRTAQAYDGVFAYRFMYRLRNYAQHCSMPIGHIQVQTHQGPDSERQRSVILAFDVPELLEQGADNWGATVKTELQALPPLLDVAPLVEKVWPELAAVSEAVEQSEKPELAARAETIVAIGKPVVEAGGRPIVGLVKDTQVEMVRLPYDILTWVGQEVPAVVT